MEANDRHRVVGSRHLADRNLAFGDSRGLGAEFTRQPGEALDAKLMLLADGLR
jgi:hypothetical protein